LGSFSRALLSLLQLFGNAGNDYRIANGSHLQQFLWWWETDASGRYTERQAVMNFDVVIAAAIMMLLVRDMFSGE
jgi:hypothetical protein